MFTFVILLISFFLLTVGFWAYITEGSRRVAVKRSSRAPRSIIRY